MILLTSKKCNTNNDDFSKKLNAYNNGNTNCDIKCPHCDSNDLICHGYYKRDVIFIENGCFYKKKIRIKRVKCKVCNKTHAILPPDIIPYKQVVFPTIIKCIFDYNYFINSPFSLEVRQKWIKQYKFFLPYIKTIFGVFNDAFDVIKSNFQNFFYVFYLKTRKILFLTRNSIYNVGFL